MNPKAVTVKKLTKEFRKTVAALPAGATVAVTSHGERVGTFTKASPAPDLDAALDVLDKVPYSKRAGQKLIDRILKEVA